MKKISKFISKNFLFFRLRTGYEVPKEKRAEIDVPKEKAVEYDDVPKEHLRIIKMPELDPNIFHSFNLRPRKNKELIRKVTPSPSNSSPSLSLISSYQPSSNTSSTSSLSSSPSTSPNQSPTLTKRKCCCCLK